MHAMETTTRTTQDERCAFGDLLEANRGIVFKVVNSYAFNPADREDLAQEIATQLWRAYRGYDPRRRFSTWMYRIALNVAISHVRASTRHRRHTTPLDEDALNAALTDGLVHDGLDQDAAQQARALHRFIHGLEPLNRALLLLYLEDNSYREIADILGITETNVATKLSRLKQRIRDEI